MIPRYTRTEMGKIWEPENKFQKWLDVEIAACEAWAELGEIPRKSLAIIKKRAKFNIARIDKIEKTVRHRRSPIIKKGRNCIEQRGMKRRLRY